MKIAQVQKLTLKPQDMVVVQIPEHLEPEHVGRIQSQLAEQLGIEVKRVLVLSAGATLRVLEKKRHA